jgi:uncharacterized protein YceH (UPF0502 family)
VGAQFYPGLRGWLTKLSRQAEIGLRAAGATGVVHGSRIALPTIPSVNNALMFCDRSVNERQLREPSRRRWICGRSCSRPSILAAVHIAELTPPEQRVLGCLIEKRWTTPDQYPLSLNALRLACNQSTNRDPVTDYDESTVREAAQRLCKYGLARLVSGHASRTIKYRHLAEAGLGLERDELALLGVLLLRGPQTPGELKSRSERMAPLGSLADVERVLDVLAEHRYAERLDRRPGQKEDRFQQLLGGASYPPASGAQVLTAPPSHSPRSSFQAAAMAPLDAPDLAARVAALEAEVAALRADLSALRPHTAAPSSG